MKTYCYPVVLETGEEPGVVVVTFPDIPEAITEGDGRDDALAAASDALGLALLAYLREGRMLPEASGGTLTVSPDAETAAKIAVIEAFQTAGISRSELARRIGRDEKEARRILDPMHPTKLPLLSAALAALGHRLVVGVEAA
jgi:antitoxin HicB